MYSGKLKHGLILGLKLPHEKGLRILNLYSLEQRQLHGDLIEAFKIMKGVEDVESKYQYTKKS